MWLAIFLIGLLAPRKQRIWMARLALGSFCLLLLAALIKLLKL